MCRVGIADGTHLPPSVHASVCPAGCAQPQGLCAHHNKGVRTTWQDRRGLRSRTECPEHDSGHFLVGDHG